MLSILIPVRNEYENLKEIERIFQKNFNEIKHEVILINDFSFDDTLIKAQEISNNNKNFCVLDNKKKGLGGAISLGIERSKGNFVCIMMADFSDDIEDLKKYYNLMSQNNVDAVFGSRFINNSVVIDYPQKKYFLLSRGYKFEVIPINWTGRKKGIAKFNIKELRSKYLFTLIYCFMEKILLKKKKKK